MHENVEHADIIHMNGRIYDPTLGRFLQADPFIQAPRNSQSFNRYSYVLNNPLSYTDPSGYLWNTITKPFKKLQRAIIRGASKIFGQDVVRTLGNIASLVCDPAASACAGYWNYEFARAHGVSSSGALRGAFAAAIGAQVGASESLNGFQKFGINFALDSSVSAQEQNARATQIQTVGGTYSEVSGGKFANGAARNNNPNGQADRFEVYRKLEERYEYVKTRDAKEVRRYYSHTVYTENPIDDALSFALSVRGALRANKIDLLDGTSMPTGLANATTFTYDVPLIRFFEVEVLYRRNLSKPRQAPVNRGELSRRYNVREEFSIRHSNFVGVETSLAYCNDGFGCSRF